MAALSMDDFWALAKASKTKIAHDSFIEWGKYAILNNEALTPGLAIDAVHRGGSYDDYLLENGYGEHQGDVTVLTEKGQTYLLMVHL